MKSFRYAFLALLASAALHLGSASAQPWPSRTVRWIVPLGAGSGADVTARLLAEQLSSRWRQPIVIENKPGADGMLGLATFVNAADDHTLLFTPTATFIVHPFLHERMPYDPAQLLPLARVSNTVIAMAVPASKNYRSLKQLIEAIRASPGRMHWTGVTGTDMVFAAFLKKHDLTMPKVPYRDTVQAINDLSEARIDLFVAAFTTVQAQLQAGRVSLLAVTNKERTTLATDVPTAREAGFPDLTVDGLAGLFGTSNIPSDVRQKISDDVNTVLTSSVSKRIAHTGQIVNPGSSIDFEKSIDEQRAEFAKLAAILGLRIPSPK